MQKTGLQKTVQILLLVILAVTVLYFAKPFLVPVCLAGLFAMLFLPLTRRLEKAGVKRGLATLCCVIIFLLIFSGIIALITWQVTNLTSDLGNIESKLRSIWKQMSDYISETFGISPAEQEDAMKQQSEGGGSVITNIGSSIMGLLVDFVLMLVYIFLFMYYRSHIKKFILKIVAKKDQDNAADVILNIEKVAQKYLTGLGIMIICLWIMYGIGFSILGLKNAFFFAILCGLFEIVPFVGNLVGNGLAILMALTQGGGMSLVIGILITYSVIQFIQTYVLEPLVVGTEVNINPLFTIMGLVVGELIWGIPGLVLAIPLLAIVKIICDHIPSLQPYGFLIGKEKKRSKPITEKIKSWFK